jgi:RNA-binding protein
MRRIQEAERDVLSSKQRREMLAAANRLKPALTISGDEPGDRTVQHVRQAFSRRELIKIRIASDDRADRAEIVSELAESVPCEIVDLIGRVAVLYRAPRGDSDDEPDR